MPILKDALLKDYAYYGTGGPCTVLYAPGDAVEAGANIRDAQRRGLPLTILGGGSNSLIMDEPHAGAILLTHGLNRVSLLGSTMTVGAGVENSEIARLALAHNLTGAAWMYRLPGQLGGTVRMNARCYGGEISQIVKKVRVITTRGAEREYTDAAMFRGYKDTIFMSNGDLIVEADLELRAGDADQIEVAMSSCEKDRTSKGQFKYPSCGCVFKNDYSVGLPSGMLLAAAGAKDLRRGGAEVSPHHANFVYNKGATSRDILELSIAMRDLVHAKFGVWLEYEMEILGTVPEDLRLALAAKKEHKPDGDKLAPLREKLTNKLSV